MLPLIPIALQLAAQFAPSIIGKLTGSANAENVAAHVVGIAQTITGTATPEAAFEAIKADPAKVLEFQIEVAKNEKEIELAYLQDTQNARAMQTAALAQEDLFSKRFVYYFAAGWSLFAMVYFACVTFIVVPDEGQRIADTILGVLIGNVLGGMFAYFYGSTKGSAEKSRLLAQAGKG